MQEDGLWIGYKFVLYGAPIKLAFSILAGYFAYLCLEICVADSIRPLFTRRIRHTRKNMVLWISLFAFTFAGFRIITNLYSLAFIVCSPCCFVGETTAWINPTFRILDVPHDFPFEYNTTNLVLAGNTSRIGIGFFLGFGLAYFRLPRFFKPISITGIFIVIIWLSHFILSSWFELPALQTQLLEYVIAYGGLPIICVSAISCLILSFSKKLKVDKRDVVPPAPRYYKRISTALFLIAAVVLITEFYAPCRERGHDKLFLSEDKPVPFRLPEKLPSYNLHVFQLNSPESKLRAIENQIAQVVVSGKHTVFLDSNGVIYNYETAEAKKKFKQEFYELFQNKDEADKEFKSTYPNYDVNNPLTRRFSTEKQQAFQYIAYRYPEILAIDFEGSVFYQQSFLSLCQRFDPFVETPEKVAPYSKKDFQYFAYSPRRIPGLKGIKKVVIDNNAIGYLSNAGNLYISMAPHTDSVHYSYLASFTKDFISFSYYDYQNKEDRSKNGFKYRRISIPHLVKTPMYITDIVASEYLVNALASGGIYSFVLPRGYSRRKDDFVISLDTMDFSWINKIEALITSGSNCWLEKNGVLSKRLYFAHRKPIPIPPKATEFAISDSDRFFYATEDGNIFESEQAGGSGKPLARLDNIVKLIAGEEELFILTK